MRIKQLLARRSDLGTFLVHLTREYGGSSAKENLKAIITDKIIEARNPFGSALSHLNKAKSISQSEINTQNVVCFTETPLEHVSLLAGEIEWRRFKFEPYGIAITKRDARRWDVNPVWYIDITPGHSWLMTSLNRLIELEITNKRFGQSDIAKLTPFIEQMGIGEDYFKEYWWEREWRHVGDLSLVVKFIIICPEKDYAEIVESSSSKVPFIDPEWSIEQIIGRLAGFKSDHIDPF